MPRLTVTGTNIDAPDANALADFYRRLLGWTTRTEERGWVVIQPGASDEARGGTLSFQTESRYVRPVWPAGPGDQQMMMHLEIKVDDLEAGVAHAVAQGATLAGFQPQEDVRVCLDPAGHPFCLYLG
jgi:catechol 2,3-dioxygenase-like lactoylglutathione lyase family enzyme